MALTSTFVRSRMDGMLVLRTTRPALSTRVHDRAVVVTVTASLVAAGVVFWSLTVGTVGPTNLSFAEVVDNLLGRYERVDFLVQEQRLPRGLTGLMVGAAFGLSGAVFQRIARNPLASPDLIGPSAGAAAAAVGAIVLADQRGVAVTYYALVGALVTSVAIYLLAYKKGVSGYRLVLVGIGATAMLTSVTSYLLTRADLYQAQSAVTWLTGSLDSSGWDHVRQLAWALAVLVPLLLVTARHLRMLELGDDTARGLGARAELTRGALLLAATGLTAVATAAAGPVGFVALVSPHIARLLVGGRSLNLLPAAAVGALLITSADLFGRWVVAPTELPVGVITAIIGAPFLLVLLARANRVGAGG